MSAKRILTIEDIFDIPSLGGLVVVPGPLQVRNPGRPEGPVTLRRPDGSTVEALLTMQHFFLTPPPKEPRWGCILKGIAKEDVPIGTGIWADD